MHPIVEAHRAEVEAVCRRRGVRKLELFGSAARGDFDELHSDIDLLVEFSDRPMQSAPWAFFDLKFELEAIFGRPCGSVDALLEQAGSQTPEREELDQPDA